MLGCFRHDNCVLTFVLLLWLAQKVKLMNQMLPSCFHSFNLNKATHNGDLSKCEELLFIIVKLLTIVWQSVLKL